MDEDEESAAGSSNDETMEDVDAGDQDATAELDEQGDNDEDNDDNAEEDDADDTQNTFDDSPLRPRPQPAPPHSPQSPPAAAANGRLLSNTSHSPPTVNGDRVPPSAHHGELPTTPKTYLEDQRLPDGAPPVRPEAVTAPLYDIAPTIAAPHSTSINAITATPDMRWVFSGGADGWIRKFNWVDTVNAKSMLTVAQRHPFVDSVTKAGVLMSYWENEEPSERASTPQPPDEALPLSSVYSLAVHRQALWLLSGTEIGAINLQSVRHDEGKRITSLYQHTSAVSVMSLSQDQASLLSGSWDKSILDWDLNTGQVKRNFMGSKAQISALEVRPNSTLPVPTDSIEPTQTSNTFTTSTAERVHRGSQPNGVKKEDTNQAPGSPNDSLFGGGSDHDSLFGDNDGVGAEDLGLGDDQDDEIGKAIASGIRQQEQLGTNGDPAPSLDQKDAMDFQPSVPEANSGNEQNDLSMPSTIEAGDDSHGLPDIDELLRDANQFTQDAAPEEPENVSESTFLDAAIDGTLRVWDRRQPTPITRIVPSRSTPPWCMHASWSPDGNYIYAGRRNTTVDEYSLHKGLREPIRSLKLPAGSGPVSAVRAMANNKHLICASHDILRLYDLKDEEAAKHSRVPFLIVPGHRTGVVSHLYMDSSCSFLISTGGNRGWEGNTTEVLLGYEIGIGR